MLCGAAVQQAEIHSEIPGYEKLAGSMVLPTAGADSCLGYFLVCAYCMPTLTRALGMLRLQVATLRSAVKLEQEQQFLIAKKLQELTGSKNIKLKPVIDESLIAGFVVSYGSSQIDLSG